MGYKIYAPKPMSDESMEMLRKKGFEIIGEWQDSREDMKKYMAEADVVIARVHFFDDELLALAKNLKLIQVHGVGYQDHVVCEDAAKRGIYVAYSPYGNHFTVAEGAVALTLRQDSHQLSLSGQGTLSPDGRYLFRGTLQPRQGMPPLLALLVTRPASKNEPGRTPWQIQGKWLPQEQK